MSPTQAFPRNDPDGAPRPKFARAHVTSDNALDARVKRHLEHAARVCVFRPIVTGRSGIVTGDSGIVTGRSGDVTEGCLEGFEGCV